MARHLVQQMTGPESSETADQHGFQRGFQLAIPARSKFNLDLCLVNLVQMLNIELPILDQREDIDKRVTSRLKALFQKLNVSKTLHMVLFEDVTAETISFLTTHKIKEFVQICGTVRIIITTNNANLYRTTSECISVNGMEPEEALRFYKQGFRK